MAGLEIIGAGYGRTGTTSLKQALEYLGYRCYHMEEVMKQYNHNHVQHWDDKYSGKPGRPYDEIFERYTATVDFPACSFYRELMEAYPDARVLLSVRDSEGWWKSFLALMQTSATTRYFFFIRPMRKFYKMVQKLQQYVFNGPPNKETYIRRFEAHNEEVQASVPAEKLLVYNVKEGWEPLCTWLDKPVPDIPFPHSNAGMDDVKAKIRAGVWQFLMQPFRGRPA